MNLAILTRAARRVVAVIRECNYAQRRMATLTMTPDRYLAGRSRAADTYAEFLFRTTGPLLHEPPAAGRAHGELVG